MTIKSYIMLQKNMYIATRCFNMHIIYKMSVIF